MTEAWGLIIGLSVLAGALLGWPALAVVLPAIVALQVIRGRFRAAPLFIALACVMLGVARVAMTEEIEPPTDLASSSGAQVTIMSYPRTSGSGSSALANVTALQFEEGERQGDAFVVLVLFPDGVRVSPGDELRVTWSAELTDSVDPGYARYVRSLGAVAVARVWWAETTNEGNAFHRGLVEARDRVSRGLVDALPGDAGALAAGIVTGDDSDLSGNTVEAFRRTGTAHITAVSGANVAMVVAIWNLLIPAGRNRRLVAVQLAVVVSIWLYAFLVGLEPPAIRAAGMATLALFASRAGRRPDLLTLLALISAAMVLWNPNYVRMAAFWLSVVASMAIVSQVPRDPGAGWKSTLRGILSGVVVAQLATMPLVLFTFGTWSVASIAANALVTPLMWLAFPASFVLGGIVVVAPRLGRIAGVVPLIPLRLALEIVHQLDLSSSTLDIRNTGWAGRLMLAVPCVIAGSVLARDARRWGSVLARRWDEQPLAIAVAIAGPLVGVTIAGLVMLATA